MKLATKAQRHEGKNKKELCALVPLWLKFNRLRATAGRHEELP